MTYACPVWEFSEGTKLLKLQRLQNNVLCSICKFLSCIPVRELHMAFQVPYIYDYKTKLCRQQAQVYKLMKMQLFATSEKA
jgi:hypothetical protein